MTERRIQLIAILAAGIVVVGVIGVTLTMFLVSS